MAYMIDGGYWRRSVRVGAEVKTLHYGSGLAGLAVAMLDAEAREARDRERLERLEADAEQRRGLALERARGAAIRRSLAIVLESLGIVQYNRNAWRRCMRRRIELARRGDCGAAPSEQAI